MGAGGRPGAWGSCRRRSAAAAPAPAARGKVPPYYCNRNPDWRNPSYRNSDWRNPRGQRRRPTPQHPRRARFLRAARSLGSNPKPTSMVPKAREHAVQAAAHPTPLAIRTRIRVHKGPPLAPGSESIRAHHLLPDPSPEGPTTCSRIRVHKGPPLAPGGEKVSEGRSSQARSFLA